MRFYRQKAKERLEKCKEGKITITRETRQKNGKKYC